MKKEYVNLCKKLYQIKTGDEHKEISTRLRLMMLEDDLSDCLLEELELQKEKGNWSNIGKLIYLIQKIPIWKDGKFLSLVFPRNKFLPILCDLLDNHKYDAYMEAIADALIDISDEKAIKSIANALDYQLSGDDSNHFNQKLLYALANIRTPDAKLLVNRLLTHHNELVRELAETILRRWDD